MTQKIDQILNDIPQYAAEFESIRDFNLLKGQSLIPKGTVGVVYSGDKTTIQTQTQGNLLFSASYWKFLGYKQIK